MRLRRRIGWTIAAFGAILVVGAAAGLLWLRGSLPQTNGRITLPGLSAPVALARDAHGIPRITAASEADGYFALGFVHAQDRLWQMETQRRAGAGRLAELFGAAALPSDKFMRTLGLYRLAEASFAQLDPPVTAALDAYAAGVNAFIDHAGGPLPPEFVLLGHRPEPWRPADSLVWGRLMAMQLAGNWQDEILRARLLARLPAETVERLWPAYPGDAPVTIAGAAPGTAGTGATLGLDEIPAALNPHLASNVWAVSGAHTATGKPLLANDPHLGFQVPILWYLATLALPEVEISGATVPGVPFHLLGHNGRVAWGITTTHSDTFDLFIEREATAETYLAPDGPRRFATRSETIAVKGGEPVTLTVRETRHGPIISSLIGAVPVEGLLALSGAALEADDRSAQAVYKLNRAADWSGFVAALRDFHSPQQNFAYADRAGNIGFYVPGRVPIRMAGDGTRPRPGWSGEYDWTGWVPHERLPQVLNPPRGRIVNANNKVAGADYPHLIAAHWPEPFRAERIDALLDGSGRFDLAAMAAMQMDDRSLPERALLAPLLAVPPASPRAERAHRLLREWHGEMDRARPEPLILLTWLHALQQQILAQPLGPSATGFSLLRPLLLADALAGKAGWCGADRCAGEIAASLETALDQIASRHGDDMTAWRWGAVHQAVFEHPFLRNIPGLAALSRLSIATSGGDFTVNRGAYATASGDHAFRHSHGAGYRAVYDLADLARSRFVIATGQSGNLLSPHYRDMLTRWRDGGAVSLARDRPLPHLLTLEPAR